MANSRDFSGKVALITGSSSGIGAATAISLSKAGAQVVVTGRNADNVSKVSQECEKVSPNGLKALEVVADLIKEEDCKRLIDSTISKFGKLDILVNNAGAGVTTHIKDPSIMDSYERFKK
jgi:NAD(P)-dependent dehydrogenase (short-subunit alcohol dehydrogenase family)